MQRVGTRICSACTCLERSGRRSSRQFAAFSVAQRQSASNEDTQNVPGLVRRVWQEKTSPKQAPSDLKERLRKLAEARRAQSPPSVSPNRPPSQRSDGPTLKIQKTRNVPRSKNPSSKRRRRSADNENTAGQYGGLSQAEAERAEEAMMAYSRERFDQIVNGPADPGIEHASSYYAFRKAHQFEPSTPDKLLESLQEYMPVTAMSATGLQAAIDKRRRRALGTGKLFDDATDSLFKEDVQAFANQGSETDAPPAVLARTVEGKYELEHAHALRARTGMNGSYRPADEQRLVAAYEEVCGPTQARSV